MRVIDRARQAALAGSPTVRQALRSAIVASAVLVLLLQVTEIDRRRLFAIHVSAMAAVAVGLFLRLLALRHAPARSRFERVVAGRPAEPLPPPRQLREARRALSSAGDSAGGAHGALRSLLVEVVTERLTARHGVGLRDPRARALVGDDLWALVRPDRSPPADRHGPGLGPTELHHLLDQLEAVG